MAMCYNQRLFRDKPLEAPAFMKLVYYKTQLFFHQLKIKKCYFINKKLF